METISALVADDLEDELERYLDVARLDRSTAVRKLLAEGLEDWRRDRAVERLKTGEMNVPRRSSA